MRNLARVSCTIIVDIDVELHVLVEQVVRFVWGQQQFFITMKFSLLNKICNSNWTEWSTIQVVIGRVISKLKI